MWRYMSVPASSLYSKLPLSRSRKNQESTENFKVPIAHCKNLPKSFVTQTKHLLRCKKKIKNKHTRYFQKMCQISVCLRLPKKVSKKFICRFNSGGVHIYFRLNHVAPKNDIVFVWFAFVFVTRKASFKLLQHLMRCSSSPRQRHDETRREPNENEKRRQSNKMPSKKEDRTNKERERQRRRKESTPDEFSLGLLSREGGSIGRSKEQDKHP